MRSKHWIAVTFLVYLTAVPGGLFGQVNGLLKVSDNPRWLANDTSEAIVLTGSHTWGVFQDYDDGANSYSLDFDNEYIPMLTDAGHNFFRGWTWEDTYYTPTLYKWTGSAYDLNKVNTAGWVGTSGNLRARLKTAHSNGLYASAMLFNGWSVWDFKPGNGALRGPNPWLVHPYRSGWNVNGVNGDFDTSLEAGLETHQPINNSQGGGVRSNQLKYVRTVVRKLNSLENFVWEISNESQTDSSAWQDRMAQEIINTEGTANYPNRHLIWISCLGDMPLANMLARNAEIISPCRDGGGFNISAPDPPHATGEKVLIADSDHLGVLDVRFNTRWAWMYFLRGYHPIFMDLRYPLEWWDNSDCVGNPNAAGCWDPNDGRFLTIRMILGSIQTIAGEVQLENLVPQREGLRSPVGWKLQAGESDESVFALYSSGSANLEDTGPSPLPANHQEYVVWVPGNRTVKVCGLAATSTYDLEWRKVVNGKVAISETVSPIGSTCLEKQNPSTTAAYVLLIQKR